MKLFLLKLFFVFFFIGCFLLPESSFCQQPLTRKISFLEGLSSEVVYDLFVDKGGLLYLGTDKGLISYDGVHFDPLNIPESLGNSMNSIQQDETGRIWCKNFANELFYVQNDQLLVDKNVQALLKKTGGNLVDFSLGDTSMYILTQKELYQYVSGKMKLVFALKKTGDDGFNSIVYDAITQKLYLAATKTLFVLKNNTVIERKKLSGEQKIMELYKGQLAYCTKSFDTYCVIGSQTISLKESNLDQAFVNKFSAINDDLWLCTNKGIFEYDPNSRTFKNGILKDIRITDIVVDLEGNHWISSLDEGLFMLPNRQIFELQLNADKKRSYACISTGPNKNYFVGANNGAIIEINAAGKVIRKYETNWDNTIEFINFVGDTILTNYGYFRIGNSKVIANNIYLGKNLEKDNRGNLLMAAPGFGGLIARKIKGKPNYNNLKNNFEVVEYGQDKLQTLIFRNKRARSILFDSIQNEYYYGFIDGLFVYDTEGNEVQIKSNDNEPIIAVEMILNADGSIWVATSQRGVFLLKNKKIIKHLYDKNGLSDNNCTRIAKDNEGLWIVTEKGFDYFDTRINRIKNAELHLCIKGITINDLEVRASFIVLATNKGIFYFDKTVLNQVVLPQLNFADFLVNDKKMAFDKKMFFDYNENNVNINFKTIHYKSLGNYSYRYRLKGLDDKWYTLASAAKNINFLALNPGAYKFQINIKIGEKYTPIQEINFQIDKPFWLQIWFLTIIILLLLALLYFVYRWTELKTRKAEELKEQLALSQLTALRSQMNPHFIFNVLNAVQGLIYSNQKSKASDYLGKFSDLMRKILDTSDKNEVTVEKEFETIDLYVSLEKARFEKDFEYNITFPEGVDLGSYMIPSMIIQPFVENAIKHGLMHKSGYKQLDIKVELLEDVWCFTIDDNGIGRKASEIINQKIKKHISFATKAIDNRVKLISKLTNIVIDIEVIDKKSIEDDSLGTRIKIYIPIDQK